MIRKPTAGLFISGTGTEIGKTRVASVIIRALARGGKRVGVYKPAASGCQVVDGQVTSDDALALWSAAGGVGNIHDVCPQRFVPALAPHLAARAEGKEIDRELLFDGLAANMEGQDVVVVEGAGGLFSPTSDRDLSVDLTLAFGLPVVVVAANRLGMVHETLATLLAARGYGGQGPPIAGVVVNHPAPRGGDASLETNIAELGRWLDVPLLATLAHGADAFDREVDWFAVASRTARGP